MFLTFVFSFFHLLYYLVFISLSTFTPVLFVSFLLLSQRIFYRAIYLLIYLFSYFAFPLSPLLISTLILLTLFVYDLFHLSLPVSISLSLSFSISFSFLLFPSSIPYSLSLSPLNSSPLPSLSFYPLLLYRLTWL